MLQFNVSQPINSNAAYPSITASAGTSILLLDFTQQYDYSTKNNVVANVINNIGPANPWLVFQVTGSSVPTASGQYITDIYQAKSIGSLKWSEANFEWTNAIITWGASSGSVKQQFLVRDRAFISGSNSYDIDQYLLPSSSATTQYGFPTSSVVIQYANPTSSAVTQYALPSSSTADQYLLPANGGAYTTYNYP